MATESGSKSVEIGARQFGEVSAALLKIAAQVATASEAANEIEMTTKQQSTAVEQVNQAVLGTTQATQEAEASAAQVLKTVSQLAALSNDLLSLVRSPAA
jgi:methyl-accepting chemotaxis protein